MSINVNQLQIHLDSFPENLGDNSKEQFEQVQEIIRTMRDRYQGRCNTHIIPDYCIDLQKDKCQSKILKKKLSECKK